MAVYRGCNQCQQYQMNADLSIAHQNIGDAWMRLEQPQKAITSYSEAADVHRYVLAAAPNIRTAKGALQIWFGLAYAQAFVAINTGDVAYKEAARKSIAEAEAVLAQFPNEPGLADFRTAIQEFKNSLKD
ncbi:MAG: hypothetical protein JNJ90_03540 [Saprospiraceae bacterium]|nr:hypothetical protein [Saprospiraceae bacterium]